MQIELTAKPLQFNTDGPTVDGYCEYTDTLMGFHVVHDNRPHPDGMNFDDDGNPQ